MRRYMKKLRGSFRHGEKGFTLIELLIVVAILGILAAVVIPNLAGFIGTGDVAAANTEVATIKTASAACYARYGYWVPTSGDSDDLYPEFLDRQPKDTYSIADGAIVSPTGGYWGGRNLSWSSANQSWY